MATITSLEPTTLGAPAPWDAAVAAAREAAESVDVDGRFPTEAVEALRRDGLLAVSVPEVLGGPGWSTAWTVAAVRAVGEACGSAGLVYAMHLCQVACLVGEAMNGGAEAGRLVSEIVGRGLLLASSTTEKGVGGDVSRSVCHIEHDGDEVVLSKDAPVISYAEQADVVLVTARSSADAAAVDQVLVACRREHLELERTSTWNATGFRGTESHGFLLRARVPARAVLDTPYSVLSTRTMLPHTHLLWSAAWLGIADAALSRARAVVRAGARSNRDAGGVGPLRLAELTTLCLQLEDTVRSATASVDAGENATDSVRFGLAMNCVKVTASDLLADIAVRALRICGLPAYQRSGPASLDRIVRDALGAPLMVNNDRILANSASMSLALRGGL